MSNVFSWPPSLLTTAEKTLNYKYSVASVCVYMGTRSRLRDVAQTAARITYS